MIGKTKEQEFTSRVRDVLAKYDTLEFSSEHEGFLKRVYTLTLFNLLKSYPTLALQMAFYCLLLVGAVYLLIFSGHFYLVKILYLALLVVTLGLIFKSYNFYHHFGGLTKTKGIWQKGTVLINPSLPEQKLVEVIIHEFYHYLEMKGLVREEGETFASSVGFDAAVMAGADPCDDPEFLFGFWITASYKDQKYSDERIRTGPGLTKEEFPRFKKWLARRKRIKNLKITEEQKERALRYFQRRLEKTEARKKSRKQPKKSETEVQEELFQRLVAEGASLGETEKHEAALEIFVEALKIARALKNAHLELVSLNLMGIALSGMGRTGDAIQTLSEAVKIAEASDIPEERNETTRTLAKAYMQAGRLEEALEIFQRLALIDKEKYNRKDFFSTVSQIGHILEAMGRTEDALRCFDLADRISRQLRLSDEDVSDEDAN